MLTKEISEVEKIVKKNDASYEYWEATIKLSILKSAQEKFDKLKQRIEEITSWTCKCNCVTFDNKKCRMCGSSPKYGEIDYDEMIKLLNELSSKQEGKE
jgi:cupin superfamily acireductone dioxygenase involved in methionine salvage